jgi:hypothetical protein
MTIYAKTSIPGLVRDMSTQVIINTNDAEYNRILEQRKQHKQTQAVQHQIDSLKNEFIELKEMLKQVLNGRA